MMNTQGIERTGPRESTPCSYTTAAYTRALKAIHQDSDDIANPRKP